MSSTTLGVDGVSDVWGFIEPWWAETGSPLPMGCQCLTSDGGGKKAWVASGDTRNTFVHAQCGQPSLAMIRSQDLLNLMQGGDHHNVLVETKDLTTDPQYGWIASYKWTPETIVGSVSGREARVWRPREDVPA